MLARRRLAVALFRLAPLLLAGCASEPGEVAAPGPLVSAEPSSEAPADPSRTDLEPPAANTPTPPAEPEKPSRSPVSGEAPPSPTPCKGAVNQCFGALGGNCDGLVPNDWSVPQIEGAVLRVGCVDDVCWISAGSWAHDQCCFANPSGRWCSGPGSMLSGGCIGAWNRATHGWRHNLVWRRRVDTCRVDADGIVNFAEYCAPDGTILGEGDERRCCSGTARPYSTSADSERGTVQAVVFDGSFVPVVCNASRTTIEPPSCTPTQCAADEICVAPRGSTDGRTHCVAL